MGRKSKDYLTTKFCKTCKYKSVHNETKNSVYGCDFTLITGITRHSLQEELGDSVFQYGKDCILCEEEKSNNFRGAY